MTEGDLRTIRKRGRREENGMFSSMKRLGIATLVAVALGAACVTGASASSMPADGTFTTASILSFDLVRSAGGNEEPAPLPICRLREHQRAVPPDDEDFEVGALAHEDHGCGVADPLHGGSLRDP